MNFKRTCMFRTLTAFVLVEVILAIAFLVFVITKTEKLQRDLQEKQEAKSLCIKCDNLHPNLISSMHLKRIQADGDELCCSINAKQTKNMLKALGEELDKDEVDKCEIVQETMKDYEGCNYAESFPKPKVISAHLWFNGNHLKGQGLLPVKDWYKSRDVLSHKNGVKVENGAIRVLSSGFYHIYSQVYFHFMYASLSKSELKSTDVLEHAILRYSPLLPGDGIQVLSKGNLTDSMNDRNSFSDTTSYTAITSDLMAGDLVFVETSHISKIRRDEKSSFFGMHRIS